MSEKISICLLYVISLLIYENLGYKIDVPTLIFVSVLVFPQIVLPILIKIFKNAMKAKREGLGDET